MRGMEIWISSRLEVSLAKSLSASDLNRIRIVIHSYQLAMTHDRCLWALGGSRFTTFVLAVTLIAVALFYFATPRSRINSVAVLPFVNGSSDGSMDYLVKGRLPEVGVGLELAGPAKYKTQQHNKPLSTLNSLDAQASPSGAGRGRSRSRPRTLWRSDVSWGLAPS